MIANDIALVTPKNGNGKIYEYLGDVEGGHKFRNLTDAKDGILSAEQAKSLFNIPMPLNVICNEYPMVLELIKKMNFSYDRNTNFVRIGDANIKQFVKAIK